MMKQLAILSGLCLLAGECGHRPSYADGYGALPQGWVTRHHGPGLFLRPNVVKVAGDGSLTFNDTRVSRPQLATYLHESGKLIPVPVTQIVFAPDVGCDTVTELRRLISSTLDCKSSGCVEGGGKWRESGDVVFNGAAPSPFAPDTTPSSVDQPHHSLTNREVRPS